MARNRYEIDMLNGPLMPKIVSFAVPLMLSTILQLLFNAVDLIVVGRFAGHDSLAAVGATTALIYLFVNVFVGVSLGANVCAARYFAQNDFEKMNRVVHTAITAAVIAGFTALITGVCLARRILTLMDTPAGIIDMSVLYMRIYFLGTPLFMVYNFGAAILRAVGDTKRPMVFLVVSGILNAGLNMLFVIVFSMGVAGVAIATVISQALSCALVIITLRKCPEEYRLHFSRLGIDANILGKIVSIGLPAGIQAAAINFSNVLLQSSVNSFGEYAMAGYTAAHNIFGFIYAAANAITQGCMTFTSQNLGARKYERLPRVLKDSLILETLFCLGIGGLAYFLGPRIIGIYSTDKTVIAYGMEVLSLTTLTYFLCGYMDCLPGAMRGLGYSSVPMILSIVGTVGSRIFWIYLVFPHHRTLRFLFVNYPVSWLFTCIMQVICYVIIRKIMAKKQEEQKTDLSAQAV